MSQVYLFECGGKFKIGHALDVEQRRRALLTGNPFEIRVVHTIPVKQPEKLENYFHKRFKSQRIRGEWFELSASDVAEFSSYMVASLRDQLEHERSLNLEMIRNQPQGVTQEVMLEMVRLAIQQPNERIETLEEIAVKPLITFPEAARFTGVSEKILREAARGGAIPMRKVGRAGRVRPRDLIAWADDHFK